MHFHIFSYLSEPSLIQGSLQIFQYLTSLTVHFIIEVQLKTTSLVFLLLLLLCSSDLLMLLLPCLCRNTCEQRGKAKDCISVERSFFLALYDVNESSYSLRQTYAKTYMKKAILKGGVRDLHLPVLD